MVKSHKVTLTCIKSIFSFKIDVIAVSGLKLIVYDQQPWNTFPNPFEKILNLFLSVYKECLQKLQGLLLVSSYKEKHIVRAQYFSN